MASNGIDSAEAQWRAQFDAMKAAVASLNLPKQEDKASALDFDDVYEGYSSGNAGQDVWDFISDDDDDDYSSDQMDGDFEDVDGSTGYGAEWFASKCSDVAVKNGLSSDAFQNQILSILTTESGEDELQSQLTDLVGFDDLELVIELLAHRDEIITAVTSQGTQDAATGGKRLLSKAERDEALRKKDHEHKTAALTPSYGREPQYPHVYKAYNAGNSLSHSGKKYALPNGSIRDVHDKYEEYSIPAGRKGTLGPGQKLVKISDLDGLCRNTFKGYKTLNRMQSLVHPVAYKTNENMLICAPTGAVSQHHRLCGCPFWLTLSRVKRTPPCSRSSKP